MLGILTRARIVQHVLYRSARSRPTVIILSSVRMSSQQKRKAERSVSPPPLKRKVQSTTTQNTVASFFTPTSQKTPEKTTWTSVNNTLLVAHYVTSAEDEQERRRQKRRKIAAFDLDSTLIKSKSGKKFGRGADDWTWWDGGVPKALQKLDEDGYQVVIFSNQGGINMKGDPKTVKSDTKRLSDYKTKVNAILNNLDFNITLYAATERDQYRKPRIGMWSEAVEYFDLEAEVDMNGSFFVGDAAGRTGDERKSDADFASSDRDFAANIGIPFYTPEEYFLGHEVRNYKRAFDFGGYLVGPEAAPKMSRINKQDIVLFCGSPGAGKSTFYWTHLADLGYERINQDILKTRDKCLKVAEEFLHEGKSVAIDNTNADQEVRGVWIALAKRHNIPIRCVLFKAPAKLCEHNDAVRALNDNMNPEKRTRLPPMAFSGFGSRFRPPELKEGFQDITVIEFEFRGDEETRKAWAQYYV